MRDARRVVSPGNGVADITTIFNGEDGIWGRVDGQLMELDPSEYILGSTSVTILPIPEPSTVLLVGIGLGWLVAPRRLGIER